MQGLGSPLRTLLDWIQSRLIGFILKILEFSTLSNSQFQTKTWAEALKKGTKVCLGTNCFPSPPHPAFWKNIYPWVYKSVQGSFSCPNHFFTFLLFFTLFWAKTAQIRGVNLFYDNIYWKTAHLAVLYWGIGQICPLKDFIGI